MPIFIRSYNVYHEAIQASSFEKCVVLEFAGKHGGKALEPTLYLRQSTIGPDLPICSTTLN